MASSRIPLMEDPLNLSLSNGVVRTERRLLFFDLLCLCLPLFSDCLCIFLSLHTQPHSSLKASGAGQSHLPPPSFHKTPSSSSTSPISSQGWGLPSGLLSIRQFLWKALEWKVEDKQLWSYKCYVSGKNLSVYVLCVCLVLCMCVQQCHLLVLIHGNIRKDLELGKSAL